MYVRRMSIGLLSLAGGGSNGSAFRGSIWNSSGSARCGRTLGGIGRYRVSSVYIDAGSFAFVAMLAGS